VSRYYYLKLSPVKKRLWRSFKSIWPCEHRNLSGAECFKREEPPSGSGPAASTIAAGLSVDSGLGTTGAATQPDAWRQFKRLVLAP